MNLKKRAAGAIAVAMSVVVMTSVAQAAPADYKTGVASQATTTDLATNGIAGIAVSMSQYESDAYEYIGLADANVEQMNVARVTSGDAAEQDADAAEEGLTEMTADVADADTAAQAENAASGTETDVSTETAGSEQTEEEELWQNRLMADVNDYLYVRASADADAEIVGKLYKGDVAEIQEEGSGWTHVASGNVDGYVNNDYCVTGTEALAYAQQNFDTEAEIEVRGNTLKYVSRGGLKLEKAMKEFDISLEGMVCMDIGASTGGFTDCMLQNGAVKVYSVDVGYGQFAWKLRNDPRVVCMEKTNIRYVTPEDIADVLDFASVDVSFISLTKVLVPARELLRDGGRMVCLIKPQFEAGREKVGKKGVVRDPKVHEEVIHKVIDFALENGFSVHNLSYSPIKGPEGNIEYLVYIEKNSESKKEETIDVEAIVEAAHTSLS